MSRSTEILLAAAFAALVATSGRPAVAGESDATTSPAATSDTGVCEDDATKTAKQTEREAKLAELGRRLAAEPPVDDGFRVLNRTGHNYDPIYVPRSDTPQR